MKHWGNYIWYRVTCRTKEQYWLCKTKKCVYLFWCVCICRGNLKGHFNPLKVRKCYPLFFSDIMFHKFWAHIEAKICCTITFCSTPESVIILCAARVMLNALVWFARQRVNGSGTNILWDVIPCSLVDHQQNLRRVEKWWHTWLSSVSSQKTVISVVIAVVTSSWTSLMSTVDSTLGMSCPHVERKQWQNKSYVSRQ